MGKMQERNECRVFPSGSVKNLYNITLKMR